MIEGVWSQAERARLKDARTCSRGLPRLGTPKALTVLHVRVRIGRPSGPRSNRAGAGPMRRRARPVLSERHPRRRESKRETVRDQLLETPVRVPAVGNPRKRPVLPRQAHPGVLEDEQQEARLPLHEAAAPSSRCHRVATRSCHALHHVTRVCGPRLYPTSPSLSVRRADSD